MSVNIRLKNHIESRKHAISMLLFAIMLVLYLLKICSNAALEEKYEMNKDKNNTRNTSFSTESIIFW